MDRGAPISIPKTTKRMSYQFADLTLGESNGRSMQLTDVPVPALATNENVQHTPVTELQEFGKTIVVKAA